MAAPTETDKLSKTAADTGAESPTTARPLEMDDDDVQETGVVTEDGAAVTATPPAESTTVESTEAAPPKPPRPLTEAQKNEMILKEAFPGVEQGVIRAVMRASGGQVEPAFNALLEMTDPEAVKNDPGEIPPAQPPRPQAQENISQLEADELYARQLAEHYDNVGAYEARTANRNRGGRPRPGVNEDDREHSFVDDDLPVIRENLRKGFLETQTKVNGWITTLRKRIEENFDESEDATHGPGQQHRPPQGDAGRRSGDYDRYDADPQVLGDDFAGMRFSGDGTPANRPMGGLGGAHRPPPSTSPRPNDGRRVGFREETEEINMYESSPKVPPKDAPPTSGAKASKWQPLSSVDPAPMADNDPFSLGDSEDEKEAKDTKETKDNKEKPKDGKQDDNERLKLAAAEAMSDNLVDPAEQESAVKNS